MVRAGSCLVPCPLAVSRSVLMSHSFGWMREHGTLHIPDVRAQNEFPNASGSIGSSRTFLVVPLRQQGELDRSTGRASHRKYAPSPRAQIKLLETFADQAVIAHRKRAFVSRTQGIVWSSRRRRVKYSGVIASSPTDIQPVLDVVARTRHECVERPMHVISPREGWQWYAGSIYGFYAPSGRTDQVGSMSLCRCCAVRRSTDDPYSRICRGAKRVSDSPDSGTAWVRTCLAVPLLEQGSSDWCDHDPPHRSPPLHRQANQLC